MGVAAHELLAAEKKTERFTYLTELFYCFSGITPEGKCVCRLLVSVQAARVSRMAVVFSFL
jgi:hypothetical protein